MTAQHFGVQGLDANGATYDLVGVVVHSGSSMRTGHYYAYVRRLAGHSAELPQASAASPAVVKSGCGVGDAPNAAAAAAAAPNAADPEASAPNAAAAAIEAEEVAEAMEVDRGRTATEQQQQSCGGGRVEDPALPSPSGSPQGERAAAQADGEGEESVGAAREAATASPQAAWYYVSDTSVRRVSVAKVLRDEAYILMYQRADL